MTQRDRTNFQIRIRNRRLSRVSLIISAAVRKPIHTIKMHSHSQIWKFGRNWNSAINYCIF